jgi:serine/threonine protein kinase
MLPPGPGSPARAWGYRDGDRKIGHYTIVSELGRGGMGVVYKAHEESLNRFVAIKVLGEQLSGDPSFVARFVREAQAAAALSHRTSSRSSSSARTMAGTSSSWSL